jgi:hypothetical protein
MVGIVPAAAATEQDSSKLMELVAEIIKELDERDRKLKSAVVNKDCDESSFGMSFSQRKRKRIEECFGWLKDDRLVAKGSASWSLQGGMGLHLCGGCLQPGPHAEPGYAIDVS